MSPELRELCDEIKRDGYDRQDQWSFVLAGAIENAVTRPDPENRSLWRKLAFKTLEKQAYSKDFGPTSIEHRAIDLMEKEWKKLK